MADFKDCDGETWSHVIKDKHSGPMFFGDFDTDNGGDFDFEYLRLQIEKAYRVFTWPQAREFAETIIALADKHEEEE